MSREDLKLIEFDVALRRGSHDETVAILAVGSPSEWRQKGNALPTDGAVAFAAFHEVNRDLLSRLSPSCILSPALSHEFDCIDLAQLLHACGYRGRYRAFSSELPRPELVEREVAQLCPNLNFGILLSN